MPVAKELIAHGRTELEVADAIGADKLIFQELDDLIDCITEGNPKLTNFDCSVFTGEYITGETEDYFNQLRERRSDVAKDNKNNEMAPIDLACND